MIKKVLNVFKKLPVIIGCLSLVSTLGFATVANAVSYTASQTSATSSTSADKLSAIISKGDSEIARRLITLNKLDDNISASAKISASDKTSLTTEVNNEISGLNTDKTTLDATTTLLAAHTAAQSIFTEYRVYALVAPQVFLIRSADRQQLIETKLLTLYSGITTALGSSTTSTQTSELATLNSDISSASSLSVAAETAVLALNPTDYNNDHTLLLQYYNNLKTAQSDITQAIATAKTLISSIK